MKKIYIILVFCMIFIGVTPVHAYSTSYAPTGCVDLITSKSPSSIYIAGWSYDKDSTSTSNTIKAYIGSTCIGTLDANQKRDDVNNAYKITGQHGYSGTLNVSYSGTQTITIKAVDLGTNKEYTIGSKTITIQASSSSSSTTYTTNYTPNGCVDLIQSTENGKVYVAGWAYDKDSKATSISVKVYIGSTCLGTLEANQTRDDVNNAFGLTGKHGFSGNVATTLSGTQTVTVKMVDLGTNKEYTISSKTITIKQSTTTTTEPTTPTIPTTSYTSNYTPNGCVDLIQSTENGKVYVAGWAYDKDSKATSISVKVYIGSTCLGILEANQTRDDVNSAFGLTGKHGFSGNVATTLSGTQTITVKMVDLGTNKEYTISSKSITIKQSTTTTTEPTTPTTPTTSYTTNYTPNGCVDLIQSTENGKVYVAGWAYDKDSKDTSISVKVYIGSTCLGTLEANQTRDDVNKAFSITGKHGFSGNVATTLSGTQTVTVKMVDLGTNKEYTISSKSITIKQSTTTTTEPTTPTTPTTSYTTNYTPNGCVDVIQSTENGKVYVAGWAYDKDSKDTSISVKVYIGSSCLGTLEANQTRDDVNKAFSITGKHGFSGNVTTTLSGTQTVTVKMIDLGTNKEYTINSKTITIKQDSSTEPSTPEVEDPTYTTNYIPKGNVDSITAISANLLKVSGWAFDEDGSNVSLDIKVYCDSSLLGTITTKNLRSDVNKTYSIEGNHGYEASFKCDLSTSHTITVKAVDLGTNEKHLLGSSNVQYMSDDATIKKTDAHFIAHRGYSSIAPENTVKSFTLAGIAGFWGCETDIYITKDSNFICNHDPNLKKMTGTNQTPRNLTLNQIKQLNVIYGNNLSQFANDSTATHIASLQEYLYTCKSYNMIPIIEIKDGPYAGLSLLSESETELLYQQVKEIMGDSKVYYIAFDLQNLITLRKVMTKYGDIKATLQYLTSTPNSVDFVTLQAYMISVDAYYPNVTSSVIQKYKSMNMELGIWTCDSTTAAKQFINQGILNITSNVVLWK